MNNEYGIGLRDVFSGEFTKLGGTILISESYEQGGTDFRTQLTKINNKAPDAIFMPGLAKEMALILKQAKEMGINAQFLSSEVFYSPETLELAKDAAEGVVVSGTAFDIDVEDSTLQAFVKKYQETYGTKPDQFAATAYDVLKILAVAMEKGGFDGEGIKKGLDTIKDYRGVTGDTTFDENGDVSKPYNIYWVQNGKFVSHPKFKPQL